MLPTKEKETYRKLLARGELDVIRSDFGEDHFQEALVYISKQYGFMSLLIVRSLRWKRQLQQGFVPKNNEVVISPIAIHLPSSQEDGQHTLMEVIGHDKKKRSVLPSPSSSTLEEKKVTAEEKEESSLQTAENSISRIKSTKKTNSESKKQHASKRQHQHQTNKDTDEESEEGSKSRKKHARKERIEKGNNTRYKKTIQRASGNQTKPIKQSNVQPSFQNPIPLLPRKQVYLLCCRCEL